MAAACFLVAIHSAHRRATWLAASLVCGGRWEDRRLKAPLRFPRSKHLPRRYLRFSNIFFEGVTYGVGVWIGMIGFLGRLMCFVLC